MLDCTLSVPSANSWIWPGVSGLPERTLRPKPRLIISRAGLPFFSKAWSASAGEWTGVKSK